MRFGPYELEAEIGRGGMGRVYRGRHATTGAVHAVKALAEGDDTALARFQREAEALARAGGDGIVALHESGQHGQTLWYAMDLMSGGSLRDRMKARERVEWREACGLVLELARALARCHGLGIVHRDLKPENVLFDAEGMPRIADFGCARDMGAARLTKTGALLGTPAYMAPEQLDGRPAAAPADVYALGLILHELVTGKRAFAGTTVWELLKETHSGKREKTATVARCPRALDELLDRALATDAGARFADAGALARALEEVLAGATRRSVLPWLLLAGSGLAGLGLVAVVKGRPEKPSVAPVTTRAEAAHKEPLSPDEVRKREGARRAAEDLAARIASSTSSATLAARTVDSVFGDARDPLDPRDRKPLVGTLNAASPAVRDERAWAEILAPVVAASRDVVRTRGETRFGDNESKKETRWRLLATLGEIDRRTPALDAVRVLIEADRANLTPGPDHDRKLRALGEDCEARIAAVATEDPALALALAFESISWAPPREKAAIDAAWERAHALFAACRREEDREWVRHAWFGLLVLLGDRLRDVGEGDRLFEDRRDQLLLSLELYPEEESFAVRAGAVSLIESLTVAPGVHELPRAVLDGLERKGLEVERRCAQAIVLARKGDRDRARPLIEEARSLNESAPRGVYAEAHERLARAIDVIAREVR
ncbi:MAG TPA: serine/threonine-protein kinase [Planctomycetota bacterium]|nr:serine/threonine-protein kinase [Planctomycetota bacterium]